MIYKKKKKKEIWNEMKYWNQFNRIKGHKMGRKSNKFYDHPKKHYGMKLAEVMK